MWNGAQVVLISHKTKVTYKNSKYLDNYGLRLVFATSKWGLQRPGGCTQLLFLNSKCLFQSNFPRDHWIQDLCVIAENEISKKL